MIVTYLLLTLYLGVLLHNTIPHVHIEVEGQGAATHQHHHSTDAHDHHEESSENSAEDAHSWPDLPSLIMHPNLGVNHFNNFNSPGFYFFTHPLLVAVLLLLGSFWPLLLLYQVIKPPGNEPGKRLQLLHLSATSRRGPPSFS